MEVFYCIYQYISYQLWWGPVKYYDMIEITIKIPAVHKECFKPELKENKTPKQTISASILHVTLNSIIVSIATNVDRFKGKKWSN